VFAAGNDSGKALMTATFSTNAGQDATIVIAGERRPSYGAKRNLSLKLFPIRRIPSIPPMPCPAVPGCLATVKATSRSTWSMGLPLREADQRLSNYFQAHSKADFIGVFDGDGMIQWEPKESRGAVALFSDMV
jgi:hypothetical protein